MHRLKSQRAALLDWFQHHPEASPRPAEQLVGALEENVRRHAEALAWERATAIAHQRGEAWDRRSRAMHCPEDWAAREFCREFAHDLRMLEPVPEMGSEAEYGGEPEVLRLPDECRDRVRTWIHDLAIEASHHAWLDVIRFTKGRADRWIEAGEISTESDWDATRSYTDAAVHAAHLLERDYAFRAHPRAH